MEPSFGDHDMKITAAVQEKDVASSYRHDRTGKQLGVRVFKITDAQVEPGLTRRPENFQLHADVLLRPQLHVLMGGTGNVCSPCSMHASTWP